MSRVMSLTPRSIVKRDGSLMPFDAFKIRQAVVLANRTIPSETLTSEELDEICVNVVKRLDPETNPGV